MKFDTKISEIITESKVGDIGVKSKSTNNGFELTIDGPASDAQMLVSIWMKFNKLLEKDGWVSGSNGDPHKWIVYKEV